MGAKSEDQIPQNRIRQIATVAKPIACIGARHLKHSRLMLSIAEICADNSRWDHY